MVTNLDIIVKKYPDIISDFLAYGKSIGIYMETGEPGECSYMNCNDCIFHDKNYPNDTYGCGVRIIEWLKSPVRRHYVDDISNETKDDTRNSNGEITW